MKRLLGVAAALAWVWFTAAAVAQVSTGPGVYGPFISTSSGNVAAATATATLPAPTGNPAGAWLVGAIEVTGSGATAASVVTCTLTGVSLGTLSYNITVVAGVTTTISAFTRFFQGGLQGIPGTAIVWSCPSFGAGNTNAVVNLSGVLAR